MRVEIEHNRHLLCGIILQDELIVPGQIWAPADGCDRTVRIESVEDGIVKYSWEAGYDNGKMLYNSHTKDAFAFQCRYCLVLEDGNVPANIISYYEKRK